MAEKGLRTWKVEGVIPGEVSGQRYGKNVNLVVYARSLEEVLPAVRAKYPNIIFYKVLGDRWAEDVILVESNQPELNLS